MSEVDVMKTTYADEYNVHPERYLSICVTSFNLDMELDIVGQLEVNEKGTIGLDVKSNSYTAVSLTNSQESLDLFYLNAGIRGSHLESEVLESVTGIESVSTMKLFDVAKENDIEIISISKNNSDYSSKLEMLKNNNISSFALNEITEYVEAGYEVIVPSQNIRVNSWSGTGYIVVSDNGYEFMLSNGMNGGETSEYIQNANALQLKIILAIYSLSLIFSVFAFVSAASPIVSAFLFAETLPKGFILSSLWFITAEVLLFNSYNSFQDLLNDEATPNEGALKLTTTTFSIIKFVTMQIIKSI